MILNITDENWAEVIEDKIMVGLINDKVFTDTALKRLLKEVEKVEDTQNLTVLKTYILNSISDYPQNTFRI